VAEGAAGRAVRGKGGVEVFVKLCLGEQAVGDG